MKSRIALHCAVVAAMLFGAVSSRAGTVFFTDNFDYPTGELNG
ncbi:MAG TPA: hypothetical protein VK846_06560 [Candidatus Limnocylindria bacterium]|nr:hypothetical protein [Candidatus Limnocylindria bacterium]